MGVDLVTNRRIKDGQVIVAGHIISINLKVVSMTDFDVILGMLWLAENYASIDCHKKKVVFSPPTRPNFKFKGTCTGVTPKIVSMMKAKRLVQQGGWDILTCTVDVKGKEKTMDTVSTVNQFPSVDFGSCRLRDRTQTRN